MVAKSGSFICVTMLRLFIILLPITGGRLQTHDSDSPFDIDAVHDENTITLLKRKRRLAKAASFAHHPSLTNKNRHYEKNGNYGKKDDYILLGDKEEEDRTLLMMNGDDQGSYPSANPRIPEINGWKQSGSTISVKYISSRPFHNVAISADGRTVAGATSPTGRIAASVFIYTLNDDNGDDEEWKMLGGRIRGLTRKMGGVFGSSVSFSANGRIVAIGGRSFRLTGVTASRSVSVYFYDPDVSDWKLMGDTDNMSFVDLFYSGKGFGDSVSLSNDGMTVAAGGSTIGHINAKVFNFNGTAWNQFGQDIEGGYLKAPQRVALSGEGNTVAVASYNYTFSDVEFEVQVYSLSSSNGVSWLPLGQTLTLQATRPHYGGFVKMDLSKNGRILALAGMGAGYTRVYSFDEEENKWVQMGQQLDINTVGEKFGGQASLSDDGCTLAGYKYYIGEGRTFGVYSFDGNKWVQIGGDFGLDVDADVAISGDGRTVVGTDSFQMKVFKAVTALD